MKEKNDKTLLYILIGIALVILIGVGSTFAYFTATINSAENAISATAATFEIEYEDDVTLQKSRLIPSAEKYVDISLKRYDAEGNFLKPTKNDDGTENIKNTVCIDDNDNEICSVYSFTIINKMTKNDLPLYIFLETNLNNFENLYYKVLDSEYNEVISATRLQDDRYQINSSTGAFEKTESGELIPKENFAELKISPSVLTNINKTLPRATVVDDEVQPNKVTYHLVTWIMETNEKQNATDGGKIFSATMHVTASGADGQGITGMFNAAGIE